MKGPWTKASISVSMHGRTSSFLLPTALYSHAQKSESSEQWALNKLYNTQINWPCQKMVLTHLTVIQRFTVPESQVTKISFCTVCKLERQVGVARCQADKEFPDTNFTLLFGHHL